MGKFFDHRSLIAIPVTAQVQRFVKALRMITCPFCQLTLPDNTIFCSECGTYLLEKDKQETDPLREQVRSSIGSTTGNLKLPTAETGAGPTMIRLLIERGFREVELALEKAIHLGRLDPLSDNFPEVDFTDAGGVEKGVSRRHARIFKKDESLIVEDLGSINGTYINGQKLSAYTAEVIKDGDVLQLGRLVVQVRF